MAVDDVTRTNPTGGDVAVDARGGARPFDPGVVLAGRYRIVGAIGRGGMGDVYRAEDLKLGVTVALKFLPAAVAREPQRLARFHGEVRHARAVSHANVCRVYDIVEADGHTFITMEYIDGEDLASLLRRIGRLSADKAVDFIRQICYGVAAAHDANILHRDLKPANIMIDGRGKVRITDFGLAGLREQFAGRELKAGTPAYMAPEQIERGEVSERTDIYALGLVLFEMVTGQRTFNARTIEEYCRLHTLETPTHPSSLINDLDPVIERVILRCLEKDPKERPNSALALAAALPGGDPLAAVLAAGEIPSPEMVAAAGEHQGLRPRVALAWFAAVVVGVLGLVFAAAPATLLNHVEAEHPPQVLAARAQELLERLGLPVADGERAYGLRLSDEAIETLRRREAGPPPDLGSARPAPVTFWYRFGPEGLIPTAEPLWVAWDHPPNREPGMIQVGMSLGGRLEHLHYVPPRAPAPAPDAPVTFEALLEAAGLSPAELAPIEPQRDPPSPCDAWQAWRTTEHYRGDPLEVEAGLLRGRAVYFAVQAAGAPAAEGDASAVAAGDEASGRMERAGNAVQHIRVGVLLVVIALSGTMAWRNTKLGRGDRRGALRVAAFVFATQVIAWLLVGADGGTLPAFVGLAYHMSAYAVLFALLSWVGYIAIEPYVRRRWPTVMISWTRLLAGRFTDPLLGRDALIGVAFGVLWGWLFLGGRFWCALIGAPAPLPQFGNPAAQLVTALGPAAWFGMLLSMLFSTLSWSILALLLLFAFRAVFRAQWLAIGAFIALFAVIYAFIAESAGGFSRPENVGLFISRVVVTVLLTVLLLRFGIVAATVGHVVLAVLVIFPLTTDAGAWYFPATATAVGLIIALAAFATHTSRAGQPLVARDLFDG